MLMPHVAVSLVDARDPGGAPRAVASHIGPDAFADSTVSLVQWIEDSAHHQRVTAGLIETVTGGLQLFLDQVATHYHAPGSITAQSEVIGGAIRFRAKMPDEIALRLADEEPFLFAALNTPSGLCSCHAVPGVRHDH